jgi:4-amino-4-deoxy-L-arabinose transferase-like glycosyltransferase
MMAVFIGVALVSASIAPFHNIDTDLEYQTALGVIKWGMPFNPTYGTFLNQPPVGFYIEALFFKLFGPKFDYGTTLITAFGLGTALLVYEIGKLWYGKRTGLLAAALFALTPWQLVLCRSFLIDAICLFFSLLFLLFGMLAIRKRSFRLFMASGAIFAIAFLTKFYAVYTLIPLGLYFLHDRPRNLKQNVMWVGSFFLPLLLGFLMWYQLISGQGLLAAFRHDDFAYYNLVVPSPFFVGNFLSNGLGIFPIVCAALSLTLSFLARKHFGKIVIFDTLCLVTIVVVVAVDTYLGAAQNLSAPYTSPIKYVYQSLPYFCLLSGSLIWKTVSLLRSVYSSRKLLRGLAFSIVVVSGVLVTVGLFRNGYYVHNFSTWNYLYFQAAANQPVGYSFFHPNAISQDSPLMVVQYLGFGLVLSGLLWAGKFEQSIQLRCFLKLKRDKNKCALKESDRKTEAERPT